MGNAGCTGRVARASTQDPGRPSPVFRSRDRNGADIGLRVFGMRLRQTKGFMSSVLELMGLDLPVPDHTTLSRRAQPRELPSRRNRPLPDGLLHVLVDSTGLKIYGAPGNGWRRNMAPDHAATGANSIWQWMPIVAKSLLID